MAGEIDSIVIRLRAAAEGVEAGVETAKRSMRGLDKAYDENAKAAQRASVTASQAYKLAELAAADLAHKAKYASDEEKSALEASAKAARRAADEKKLAANAAALAYEGEASKAQEAAQAAQQSSAGQQIAMTALAAVAAKTFQTVSSAVNTGIDAYNRYKASTQGLIAIAQSKGIGQDTAIAGAKKLKDALLDTASAQKALQNLLGKGFSLEGALETIQAIKDSAAVNRAAHLSVAEAVVQTTEGIKNENSTLSDQAGITKNLSVMLKEYADANGLVAANLTDAQKAEAYRLGVLQEAAPFVGAASKQMKELSGAQATAAAAADELAVAYGSAMAPSVKAGTNAYGALLGVLNGITTAAPGLVSALTMGTGAAAGLLTVMSAVKALNAGGALAALFSGPAGWAALGIGAIAAGVTAVITATERAKAAAQKLIEDRQALIDSMENEITSAESLTREYERIGQKANQTNADKARMLEIEKQLSAQYRIVLTGLDGQKKGYAELTEEIQQKISAQRQELAVEKEKDALGRFQDTGKQVTEFKGGEQFRLEERIRALRAKIEDAIQFDDAEMLAEAESALEAASLELAKKTEEAYAPKLEAAMDIIASRIEQKNPEVSSAMLSVFKDAYKALAANDPEQAISDGYLKKVQAAFEGLDLSSAIDALKQELATIAPTALLADGSDTVRGAMVTDFLESYRDQIIALAGEMGLTSEDAADFYAKIGESVRYATGDLEKMGSTAQEAIGALDGAGGGGIKEQVEALRQKAQAIQDSALAQQAYIDGLKDLSKAEEGNYDNQLYVTDQLVKAKADQLSRMSQLGQISRVEELAGMKDLLNTELFDQEIYADTRMALEEKVHNLTTELRNKALSEDIEASRQKAEAENWSVEQQIGEYDRLIDKYQEDAEAVKALTARQEELRKQSTGALTPAQKELDTLKRSAENLASSKKLNASLLDLAKQASAAGKSIKDADPALRAYAKANALADKSVDDVIRALSAEGKALDGMTSQMQSDVQSQLADWMGVRNGIMSMPIDAQMTAENSKLMAEANESISILQVLLALLGQSAGATTSKGGGGGGKSKKKQAEEEARRAAEEAARAAEETRRKQLDAEIKDIERRRAENEITTKQEIAAYEQLYQKYKQYAEHREQLEERIYEARQRLRDEEISNLDRLNGGILAALRNRYDAQRKIEEDALKASADGWQQWADESVAAIQAQIAALDELTKSEDREAQDKKELRKIDATKQLIAYELDEYSRRNLEKELAKLEEARAERMRKQDVEDQKSALQKQIEAIQERAQAEQDAIGKQQDALSALYDERTREAALRAEAERMLMTSSQNELLALLGSYAPDYEATGQSLGERLYAGMKQAMGDVTDWFAAFNSRILGLQRQAADSALAAADGYYAASNRVAVSAAPEAARATAQPVSIAPTYNFYEPVESPGDVARRVAQVNRDLAVSINL